MINRYVGESRDGVSPVVAIILMVAITVVLTGIVYYWVGNISSTTDDTTSYVGIEKNSYTDDWIIYIVSVQGPRIPLDEISFMIVDDESGVVLFKRNTLDANPPPFYIDNSMIYPIANNSSGVYSSKTGLPVTPYDKYEDYVGAIFCIIDNDNNNYLTPDDSIRIYGDFDCDGIQNIDYGYLFRIKNLSSTQQFVECYL